MQVVRGYLKYISFFAKNISYYILYFVVTPRSFIIPKLSIRKPGSSSVQIISPDEHPRAYGSKALR